MTDQNNAAQPADQEIEAIMEQAQVFASAWAFLGGPFDNGSGLEQAERERSNLRALLSKLRAEGVHAGEPVADTVVLQCPRCTGNGTILRLSGNGPNAYDVQEECSHCEGSGVVASAPVAGEAQPSDETLRLVGVIADKIEDGTLFNAGIYSRRDLADKVRAVLRFSRQGMQPATPQASEAMRILFPTHLRKMWSGGEVQAWLDNHQGITPPTASAKGSLERYRNWRAEQAEADKDGVRSEGRQ
ncbi:MAG TPA: hypothetical protein DIW53_19640 [Achromobacter sp.]|nr:hypothetical protein [Achromobacter sp.]